MVDTYPSSASLGLSLSFHSVFCRYYSSLLCKPSSPSNTSSTTTVLPLYTPPPPSPPPIHPVSYELMEQLTEDASYSMVQGMHYPGCGSLPPLPVTNASAHDVPFFLHSILFIPYFLSLILSTFINITQIIFSKSKLRSLSFFVIYGTSRTSTIAMFKIHIGLGENKEIEEESRSV